MYDKRYDIFAEILVRHSLHLQKNDLFILSGSPLTMPLVQAVYEKALEAGAHIHLRMGSEALSELFYKNASNEQLEFVSPLDRFEIENIGTKLSIIGTENTRFMSNVDPEKQSIRSRAVQPLHDIFLKRAESKDLRWCITLFPTHASAQDAEMSLQEYEEFVFAAAHVNDSDPISFWQQMQHTQQQYIEALETKKTIHILAEDTDLTLSVDKRRWINCFGKENFPDGEVFTGPIEHSADGYVHFSFPCVYGGRQVDDVKIWFEKGKVKKATASSGNEFLQSMLNMDAGARFLGEFAFGTNYGITQFTKNTLFDEKIGGTIHLAMGAGYPETGSINKSGLHWDMVCDLREDGEVIADGEVIYKKGKFFL